MNDYQRAQWVERSPRWLRRWHASGQVKSAFVYANRQEIDREMQGGRRREMAPLPSGGRVNARRDPVRRHRGTPPLTARSVSTGNRAAR